MTVPHFYQSSEQTCGAACLRMLFANLGVAQDEADIAQQWGITPLGCPVQDLVTGAQALGFNAEMLRIDGEPDAIKALSNSLTLVARLNLRSLNEGQRCRWHLVVGVASSQKC